MLFDDPPKCAGVWRADGFPLKEDGSSSGKHWSTVSQSVLPILWSISSVGICKNSPRHVSKSKILPEIGDRGSETTYKVHIVYMNVRPPIYAYFRVSITTSRQMIEL